MGLRLVTRRQQLVATLATAGASVLFAVMALLVKSTVARLPGIEVAFFRFAVGVVGCLLAAPFAYTPVRNWAGLLLRGTFGGVAAVSYFLALAHLPVGVATLLTYTSPVFTALFAALFLDEALTFRMIIALTLTTTGVILVVHGHAGGGSFGFGRWELIGVLSSVLSGAAVTTIRHVRRTDGSLTIFFSFCFISMLLTLPTAGSWLWPTPREWWLLVAMGTVSFAAQLLMTYALGYLAAGAAGILMQLTPVFALGLGVLLYGERAVGIALVGSVLTFVGVSYGAVATRATSSSSRSSSR